MKNGKYVATVIIDKKKTSCYPDEFSVVDDAYEKAAEVALDEWEPKYKKELKKMPVTTDNNLMAKRAVDIVSDYPTGCWGEAFLKQYAENYNESLPEDWIPRVKSVTSELEFTPVPDSFLVCKAPPKKAQEHQHDQSISVFFEQPGPKVTESRKLSDASNERIQVIPQEDAYWMVHVLVVYGGDYVSFLSNEIFN